MSGSIFDWIDKIDNLEDAKITLKLLRAKGVLIRRAIGYPLEYKNVKLEDLRDLYSKIENAEMKVDGFEKIKKIYKEFFGSDIEDLPMKAPV